ncbi:hypothetical protein BpHYR1_011231 [Brachionus plicatilis]|uniref:Uncharacterized protein n=1 Tax=Brachionus plicatilis TaxID=10195 RepID=A0A3M7SNL7_BRAPC|nr:hypothetical protein BpHYR1_011231 [Brachionus plicatilis]
MEIHGKYHFKSEQNILRNDALKGLNDLLDTKKKPIFVNEINASNKKKNLFKSQNLQKIEKLELSSPAKQEKKTLQKQYSLQGKVNEINGSKPQSKSNWSRIKSSS